MSIMQYLSNPQGKGSVTSYVKHWKDKYDPMYKDLLDGQGSFETVVYRASSSQFFIHVKIPSGSFDAITYDVVLKIKRESSLVSGSILDWSLRAISNSPSFVFTYENVFRRNKILVEELKSLLPDEAYDNPPKIRNPFNIVGYEKTAYFAIRYVKERYSQVSQLTQDAVKFDINFLKSQFVPFDKIMLDTEGERKKKVEENKKARIQEKKQKKRRNVYDSGDIKLPKDKQAITTVRNTSTIQSGLSNAKIKPTAKSGKIKATRRI